MKKIIQNTFFVFLACCLFWGCTQENEVSKNGDRQSEISFNLNLQDKTTTRAENDTRLCPQLDSLIFLAMNNDLQLNLTIGETTQSIKVNYIDGNFVSDPIILKEGEHVINNATISNKNNVILFSAVGENSDYTAFVEEILPKTIVIGNGEGEIPLYKKTPIDLYFICALNEKPEAFGFTKWNIHFSKIYCIPFTINKCGPTGDHVAKGTMTIKNGKYDGETGVFTPVNKTNEEFKNWTSIDTTISFPNGDIPADLCFADNYEVNNQEEYYQITITIIEPEEIAETIVGYANVEKLLQYKTYDNAWDREMNILHLNFCDCKTWFFPCEEDCALSQEITFSFSAFLTNNKYINTITYNGNYGYTQSLTKPNIGTQLYIRDKIRFIKPVKYLKSGNYTTYVNVWNHCGALESTEQYDVQYLYKVNIYQNVDDTEPLETIICNYSIFRLPDNNLMSTTLPTKIIRDNSPLISGECYYYEIEFVKNPPTVIDKIEVNQGDIRQETMKIHN